MTWPFHPLSRAGYAVIMCDPPWRFVTWSQTRQYKAPSQHYAVMGLEQIQILARGRTCRAGLSVVATRCAN
jgi:hypothetical protein